MSVVVDFRRCQGCGAEKPRRDFMSNPEKGGQPSIYCLVCRENPPEDVKMTAAEEAAQLRARLRLTPEETRAVERAVECTKAYMTARANIRHGVKNGDRPYTGPSGWEVLEEVAADDRRFHQLASLTTLLYRDWLDSQPGIVRRPGYAGAYPPEVARKVVELYQHFTKAAIAARLGIEQVTVHQMLKAAGVWKPAKKEAA